MTRARHLSLVRPDGSSSLRGGDRPALVREIASVLASTTSFRGALPRILEVLCDTLDAGAGHAWVRRAAPGAPGPGSAAANGDVRSSLEIPWKHLWHPDPPPSAFDGLRAALFETEAAPDARGLRSGDGPTPVEPGRSPAAADALGSRSVVRIDDVDGLPGGEWKDGLRAGGVRGMLALPVFAGKRPVAVLELFFTATLDTLDLPDGDVLFLAQSALERRAEYDRMRSAVQRSARLWRALTSRRQTEIDGPERDAVGGGASDDTVTVVPPPPGRQELYDPGTELPRRALLLDRVNHTLARRSRQPDRRFALVVFDIERETEKGGGGAIPLREIVATLGRRIRRNVRPGDSVGHLSPSCLGILLEDVPNRSEASAVARRLEETVREEEFDLLATTGTRIRVGIALARPAHEEAEDVADEALAEAAKKEWSRARG